MARSKSDIANSAIRIFLQDVGQFYDTARGLVPYGPKKGQKEELLEYFDNQCCYCGTEVGLSTLSQDHLVPLNKASLGLHAWGNVVPCCRSCNGKKLHRPWIEFLTEISPKAELKVRQQKIEHFIESKGYAPNVDLHAFAGNLYQDVGEVAMTLINNRYKQAEAAIKKMLKDSDN